MKRRFLWVAVLFIFGIVIADNVALDWHWPAVLAGILGLAALGLAPTRYGKFLVPPLVLLTGVAAQSINTAVLSQDDVRALLGSAPEIATIQGRLTETPFERVYERRGRESWRTMAFVQLATISTPRLTNAPIDGTIVVSTSGILPAGYYEGQTVEISGVIQLPK